MTRTLPAAFFVCLVTLPLTSLPADDPVDADLLLHGGTLHIGDGQAAQVGDVAIRGDKIVAVGEFELGQITQRVDCRGLIVSPGFIDLHNHSDNPATRNETRAVVNYLTQGCTTIVTGNCGSGPIDVEAYYSKLDERGIGVNLAHLLPQGALRREVMQSERREPTSEELTRMKELAAKAMHDGAWGMSSGLIYVPSSYADTKELAEIARVVGRRGGIYASHIRGEGSGLLDAVNEALEIGRSADVPVHISHFKSSGKDSWGLVRTAIEIIREHKKEGAVVTADQYPYVASSTSLSATFIPAWARAGGEEQMLERLSEGADSERVHEAINRKLELTDGGHRIQIADHEPEPSWAGRRLDEIADEEEISPFEMVFRILRNGGASVVNYGINEEDVRYVMQQPWVATASDGSSRIPSKEMPHPRSYGTFPRKIGHYSVREGIIPLEHAIRSASGLPADILGMKDRGYLRAGCFADVAVWSQDELIDTATFDAPHRYAEGVQILLVNGMPAIWNSSVTGALSGRALRHEPPPATSENLSDPPIVTAEAWAIADGDTGEILWEHGAREPRKSASITKTMCALVVLSLAKEDPSVLDETITFSEAADKTGGSTSQLKAGEQVPVREALYGLLLPSGNDMGNAIAEHFHDRLTPPTKEMLENGLDSPAHRKRVNFIAEMNRLAEAFEMNDTFYRIAYGDGGTTEQKTTSAADLCHLAYRAMTEPMFREIVGTKRHVATITASDGSTREQAWKNTNELLGIDRGYDGIKTGTTQNAGRCLLASGQRNGRRLFVVILGADSGVRVGPIPETSFVGPGETSSVSLPSDRKNRHFHRTSTQMLGGHRFRMQPTLRAAAISIDPA